MQDRTVVAATVSGPRSHGLKQIVGLQHPHLATVLDYVEQASPPEVPGNNPIRRGTGVAIAEYIAGQTLHERLETGALSPHTAVTWTLHIASALSAIHARGGVHGALSPRSIIVARTDGGVVPTLTNLRAIANGAYCSPERVRGGGPSMLDDAWALHATLYTIVTGASPFGGKTREQVAHSILSGGMHTLADYGLDDPALQGILSRGLDQQAGRRPRTVADLEHELTAWLVTQTDDAEVPTIEEPLADASPRSIPPPQIDDEDVTHAAVQVIPHDAFRDSSPPIPRIRNAPDVGDQAVLAALTTKIHAPDIASLMDAMGRRSSPDGGATEEEEDADDETAVMSMPELEGLRRQVFSADQIAMAPKASRRSAPEEPEDRTLKDAPVAKVPPVVEQAPAAAIAPEELPYDRRAAPSSSGDWPSRSLFDSMTEEVSLPLPRNPVDIIAPEASAPAPFFPVVAPGEPPAEPQSYTSVPPPAIPPPAPKRSRAGLWIGLVVLFVGSFAASAFLAITFRNRLPFAIPGLSSVAPPMAPPASASAAPPSLPPSSASTAPSSAPPPSESAPAVSASVEAGALPAASGAAPAAADVAACVQSFFSSDTFVREVPLAYVCDEDDPRTVATSLHRMLVKAGAGSVSGGMKAWSVLGWYELPVVVLLRRSCCPSANPLVWPPASGTCPVLGPLVDNMIASRGNADDLKAAELGYEDGIRCYFTAGLPRPFRYNNLPAPVNRTAFDEFCRDKAK